MKKLFFAFLGTLCSFFLCGKIFAQIVFVVLFATAAVGSAAWAQINQYEPSDSCLVIKIKNDTITGSSNIDSMLVDTCNGGLCARGGFLIVFKDNVFHLPYAPPDSILEVAWGDIDTNYPNLRIAFDTIYQRYGAFVLRKVNPEDTINLSTESRLFNLIFTHYTYVNPVYLFLKTIDSIYFSIREPVGPPLGSVSFSKDNTSSFWLKKIYKDYLEVGISNDFSGNIFLVNINSQIISQYKISADYVRISLTGLPSGSYFIFSNGISIPFSIVK